MTILLAPDPLPTGLRVSAYRAPESGYSSQVPDTWYRYMSDPHIVDGPRLRAFNTGWGPIWESGQNISSGSVVRVPALMPDRASGGMGTVVEVGQAYGSGAPGDVGPPAPPDDEWCCDFYEFWCDADDCKEQDLQAAAEMAAKAGGGVVVDKKGKTVAAVTVDQDGDATVTKKGEPGFDKAVDDAGGAPPEASDLPNIPDGSGTPSVSGDSVLSSPSVMQARASAGISPAMLLGGVALIAAVAYFSRKK